MVTQSGVWSGTWASCAGTESVPSSTGVVASANDRSTEAAGGSYPSKQPMMTAEH